MTFHFKPASELKPVLGAYAAMARNNAYLTVIDIMDQLHLKQGPLRSKEGKELDLESHIWMFDLFPKNAKLIPELEARATRLFRSHFPFLDLEEDISSDKTDKGPKLYKNNSYERLSDSFLQAIETLTHIRDTNLHYKTNDNKVSDFYYRSAERSTGLLLKDVLKAAPRKIKERYKNTGLLPEGALTFFTVDNFIRQGKKFSFNTYWAFSPVRHPLKDECTVLKNSQTVIDKFTGKPKQFDRLSMFGEILLVALFTEKRYIPDFIRDCGLCNGLEAQANEGKLSQQRIIREIISAYSIRLPERKLYIDISDTQVKLDILNELAKCPSELYDVLPENERRSFETTGSDGTPVLMKRYSDRYVPLMLKYIDSSEIFNKIRFQVNTGLFRYVLHGQKEYMDGIGRERIVQEGVNGFLRIQDAEAQRKKADTYLGFPILETDEEGNQTEMPYITDSSAKYILNGDLIGLTINGDFTPSIERKGDERSAKYKVLVHNPDCWLSRFELPALAFYIHLSQLYNISRSAEDIITDTVNEYRNFFLGVSEGRITSLDGVSIPEKNIPEKLIPYLNGKAEHNDFEGFKRTIVASLIKDTKERLTRIKDDLKVVGTKENRIGKRSFVRIRPGKLADFLAEDIVRFQSYPDGRPELKLTGQQYSILQGMMATFSDGLEQACKKAGLLDGACSHPFLRKVFLKTGMNSTIDFYTAYLKERLAYLKGGIPDNASFLHQGRKKWTSDKSSGYYQALASRYIRDEKTGEDVGIFLPKGIFEKPVLEIIQQYCSSTAAVLSKADRVNMSYIILTYLEEELKDQNQGFYYCYERLNEYGLNKAIEKEIKENGVRKLSAVLSQEQARNSTGNYYKELKEIIQINVKGKGSFPLNKDTQELAEKLRILYKRKCVNEKAIRRYMVQDTTLFLLARDLIGDKAGRSVALSTVGPEGNGILDQKVNVTTNYNNYLILQEGIKIKDYGEIYKILKDRRTDSMLRFQRKRAPETINLEELKEELVTYNRKRVPVVKTIQYYEKGVYDAHKDQFQSMTERYGFKEILDADMETPQLTKEAVRQVRNAFSHNKYPERVVIKGPEKMELYQPDLPDMAKDISENTEKLIKKGGAPTQPKDK